MLPDFIRKNKETQLLQFKAQRKVIEDSKKVLVEQKLALKRAENDQKNKQADAAYETYKQKELKKAEEEIAKIKQKLNDDFLEKSDAIAQFKDKLDKEAILLAQSEADAEIQLQLSEYDREISALEEVLKK